MRSVLRLFILFLLALLIAILNVFITRGLAFPPDFYPKLLNTAYIKLALLPFSRNILPGNGFLAGLSKAELGQWIWAAFNLIILPFAFGCALFWGICQFRKVLFVFLGIGITFVFLLYQLGLIMPTFGWAKIAAIFIFIWNVVVHAGVSASSAFILGGWAGGYHQLMNNENSQNGNST